MRAVVVAGGDAASDDAAHLAHADLLVAADLGARWLDGLGIQPDVLLGDMDSIDDGLLDRLAGQGVMIVRHPAEKDASDAELAVAYAIAAGAQEVAVIGALGGERLDHELANLLLAADVSWRGHRLQIVRGGTRLQALHGGEALGLSGAQGDIVSLLPIGGDAAGVRTRGLRFPLDGDRLQLGRSRGLSNQVDQAPASVSLERGTLLVIETRKEPKP